jgi:BirA family biotin operon repressor/biotin-[acetyl-CoA-carboxylase] ligase
VSAHTGRPERAPLGSLDALAQPPWAPWPAPVVLETTPSTMTEVEVRAADGAPEGTVVVAEEQTAGRGRRGRTWDSSARAGLWWSLLLRPPISADRLGWLPLVVGVGVARGLQAAAGVPVELKWPNDVLVSGRKLAGILAERLADGSVVVGVGINVDHDASELPEGGASLRTAGHLVDRTEALVQVLGSVAQTYREWVSGLDVRDAYAALSATLHHDVQAHVGDRVITGRATRLGASGELVLTDQEGIEHLLSAGDVTLLRPED